MASNEYDNLINKPEETNEYDELIQGSKATLKQSMFAAGQGPGPDQMAKSLELSKKTGLSPYTINDNYDQVAKASVVDENEYDDLIKNNSKLAGWLAKPENGAVAVDDIQSQKNIDNAIKDAGFGSNLVGSIVSGASSLISGIAKSGSITDPDAGLPLGMQEGTAYEFDRYERRNDPINVGLYNNTVTRYLDETAKKYAPPEMSMSILSEASKGNYANASKALAYQIASNMPQMALLLFNPEIGLTALGLSSAGSKMQQNIDAGIAPDTARSNAMVTAAIEVGIEHVTAIGSSGYLKNTIKEVADKLGVQSAKELVKSSLLAIGKNSLGEGAEEFATSLSQDLVDYSMDVNTKAMDGLLQRAGDAFLVGAGSGGLTDSMVRSVTMGTKAIHDKTAYEAIGEQVLKSKLVERSIESQHSALVEMTTGTNVEDVFIAPEAFETYFQSKNIPPAQAAQEMGMLEQYNAAKENGGDIQVKYADFIAQTIKTEHYTGLADDIRFSSDAMSVNESKGFQAEIDAESKKEKRPPTEIQLRAGEVNEIKQDVQKQLKETGLTTGEASKIASIHSSFMDVVSKAANVSPKELQQKYDLKIQNSDYVAKEDTQTYDQVPSRKKTYNQSLSPLGFYSQVESEVSKMDFNQIPAKDLSNRIKNIQGLKAEELEFTGLQEFLDSKEGKVTKTEVLEFLKNNGVQVEQVVLGGSQWSGEGAFSFTEPKFVPLSEQDSNSYDNAVQEEVDNKISVDDQYYQERLNELKAANPDLTDKQAIKNLHDEFQKEAEEYVDSEDYYNAIYVVEEENFGYTLQGNNETGYWYSPETRGSYEGNLEEAKIQLAADIAKREGIDFNKKDLIKDSDINWGQVESGVERDKVKRKEKSLAKKNAKEYEAKAREAYPNEYSADLTPEKIEENNKLNIEMYAREDAEKYFEDPKNNKNTITVNIKNKSVDGKIVGNDVNGYEFEYGKKKVKLEAKELEAAKTEAVQKLVDGNVISSGIKKDADVNTPTGKSKWDKYSAKGEKQNYREFLLTLPKSEGTFNYDIHFDQDNILAHVRVSDRLDEDGKKVLFIEEIQSDWHQQGREKGYSNPEELKKLKEELKAVEDELENVINSTTKRAEEIQENVGDNHLRVIRDAVESDQIYKDLSEKETQLNARRKELGTLIRAGRDAVPNAPFKNTDAWAALAMKRMIRLATEQGYEAISWTPADVHVERWGTDSVSWTKKTDVGAFQVIGPMGKIVGNFNTTEEAERALARNSYKDEYKIVKGEPYWLVGSAEQSGGNADGMDIEAVARSRGQLLERRGERVTTKEELSAVIADTLRRERNDRSLESLTDRVWKRMQGEESDTGAVLPRKEGMEFFYNKVIPDVTKKILKKLDPKAKIEVTQIGDLKALKVDITPEIQAKAKEGFTLFQGDANTPRGQIVFGKDRKFQINLFAQKDLSTPLHEWAHFAFEVMGDMAELEQTDKKLKDDFKSLLDFVGVNSREEIKTEHHEKIAEAFEAYIMEGKAPSEKLRSAFAAFKVWLTSIYKQIRPIVDIPDNVKSVFDRLLATQEEINAVQGDLKRQPLFTDPRLMGLTEKETDNYIQATDNAKEEAKDILERQLMDDFHKQESKFYKERRKIIENEEREKLKNSRKYRSLETLRNGELDAGQPFKIQKSTVKDSEGLARGITAKEGIHVEIAAELLGYADGAALIADMTNMQSLEDAVKEQTDARMSEEYPDSLTDGTLDQRVIEAAHNDSQADLLLMEMQILIKERPGLVNSLIKKLIRRMPTKKDVRQNATKSIGKLQVKEIKPVVYKNAEIKAAIEAGNAWVKGDIEAAFNAKRKELINHELYRAAIEAKAKVKKDIKNFRKIFKSDEKLSKTRDTDIVNAARAILADFGLTTSEKTADEYLAMMKAYDPDTYGTISILVDSATAGSGPYESVSFNDFVAMSDAVMALWDLSKSSMQIEIDGKRVDRAEIDAELAAAVDNFNGKMTYEYEGSNTTSEKWKTKMLSAKAALRRVEHWAQSAGPAFTRYIWNPISEGTNNYRQAQNIVINKYKETFKILDRTTLNNGEILAPEITKLKFTNKAELLAAILHTGNESNLTKLLVGRGWGTLNEDGSLNSANWQKFVDRMQREGVLTKADYDWAQAVWDLTESLKPEAQKAHKKMYGYYFNEITANEIVTPFGIYRGGYVPAIADPNRSTRSAIRNEKQLLEEGQNSFMFPTTGRGFTKSRIDAVHEPLSLDIDMVGSHIDKVLRFIHIEPRVKEIGRLVTNGQFREALDQHDSVISSEMLVPWLQRAASQKVNEPGRNKTFDAIATALRTNTGLNIMAGNTINVVQNYTGIMVAVPSVGVRPLLASTWNYVKNSKTMAQIAVDKSVFMENELKSSIDESRREIKKIIVNQSEIKELGEFIKANGYILQKLSQNQNNLIVWHAAYDNEIAKGSTEVEAVREADSIVRTTQSSMKAEDVSRFETGTPFVRLFSQFYSYFNNIANHNATKYQQIVKEVGLKKGAGRLAVLFFAVNYLPAVTAELLRVAMSGKGLDGDDDGEYLDDALGILIGGPARYLMAQVPIIGQIAGYFMNKLNDNHYDDKLALSPAISVIESMVSVPFEVYDSIQNKSVNNKLIRDSLTLVGIMSGYPSSALSRPLTYLNDYADGKAEPTGPIDFTRGLVTGKPGKAP